MFFKIVVLKKLCILQYSQENTCAGRSRPSFTEHLRWLLLNFRGSRYFIQLALVFAADSNTGVCSELLWKHELNVRNSHWNSSAKKGVFRNFASFTEKQLCWSLFLIELQTFRSAALLKRDLNTDVFLSNLQIFLRTPNLKFANVCFWNLFFHLDCPF